MTTPSHTVRVSWGVICETSQDGDPWAWVEVVGLFVTEDAADDFARDANGSAEGRSPRRVRWRTIPVTPPDHFDERRRP